jgi:hypothetical protein
MPSKIHLEVKILENLSNDYAATYSDALLIDENGDELYGLFIQKHRDFNRLPEGDVYEILIDGNFLPAMAMLWRKDYLVELGGYDENLLFEDYDMHLRMFKKYKLALNKNISAKYRIHSESLISSGKINNFQYFKVYSKHCQNKKIDLKLTEIIKWTYFTGEDRKSLLLFIKNNKITIKNKLLYMCFKFNLPKILYRVLNKF